MNVAKKIIKILLNVLLFLLLGIALFAVIISVTAKKSPDGAATAFGHQLRIVQSSSMAESAFTDVSGYEIASIPVKSMIFIETVPSGEAEAEAWYAQIKKGDVLTFRYLIGGKQETITHRVVEEPVKKATGGYIFTLEGDNKGDEEAINLGQQTIDTSLVATSTNYVVGKVVGQSQILGWLVYALKSPVGIVCIILVPSAIVIVMEIVRIVSVFSAEKRERIQAETQKAKEEAKAKEEEIELLKAKLAELEKDKDGEE